MGTSKTCKSRLWLVLCAALLLAGCNGGLVAVGSGLSGGSSNSKPVVSDLQVPRSASSPASISFVVFDQDGDSSKVQIHYRAGGGSAFESISLNPGSKPLSGIPSQSGVPYEVEWDFASDLGGEGHRGGIEIELVVSGGVSPPILTGVEVGNDPPETVSVGPLPANAPEYGANTDVGFTVKDSAADPLKIKVEFNDDAAGGFPTSSWKLARPAAAPLSQATPTYAITGFVPDPAGSAGTFRWDTGFDLTGFDADVRVRFTPEDEFAAGSSIETSPFRIDNNAVPSAILQEGSLVANPDQRRGIAIPFTLFDPEGDDVQVVLQWRKVGETFPALPEDPNAIAQILADPIQRAALRILTEIPFSTGGRVVPIDATSVRLPELGGPAAQVLYMRADIVGDELAILKSSLIPAQLGLHGGVLTTPVAALPVGNGSSALVLDTQPGAAGWRLREIELGSGRVLRNVAALAGAVPSAMAYERGGAAVLVAEELAGMWQLQRIELASGSTQPLIGAGGNPAPVHGVESLGSGVALVTTDGGLIRVDYANPAQARTITLLSGLAAPRGLVSDPLQHDRVYLAERDAVVPAGQGRVLALGLDAYGEKVVFVKEMGVSGAGFPSPTSLAMERNGARLLVVTDSDPFDGLSELRGVDLGGPELGEVFEIAQGLPDDAVSLATGADGLRLLALMSSNDLAAGGGLEQTRTVVSYDPGKQIVTLANAFDPPLQVGREWRWSKSVPGLFATDSQGATDFMVWDSADVPGGGEVTLRLTPYDSDKGIAHASTGAKSVLAALDVLPVQLGGITSPNSLLSGDLNSDGLLDLVSANNTDSNLAVFFQTSPGLFPAGPSLTLGDVVTTPSPRSVAAGDLNCDGLLDLVSANSGAGMGGNLTVFFQTGVGQFPMTPDLTLGGNFVQISVAVADLNGDGLTDIVSANVENDSLNVFFQTTCGQLPTNPDLSLGNASITNGPNCVRVADLNRDGLLDLFSTNQTSDNLSVFFQTSPGLFPLNPSFTLGNMATTKNPRCVAAGDLNGDGLLDLVVASQSSSDLTVFLQTGAGYPASPNFTLMVGRPTSVAIADLNGDGRLDLVATSQIPNALAIFLQTGSGQFPPIPSLSVGDPSTLFLPQSVVAADLNGDGLPDLASANSAGGNLGVFFQTGLGLFMTDPSLTTAPGGNATAAADLNGDGLLDLAVASSPGPSVFFQTTLGQFSTSPNLTLAQPATISVASADLNGDGLLDMVTANGSLTGDLTVFFQTLPGQFPTVPSLSVSDPSVANSWPLSVVAADLNDDGLLDLASANGPGHNLTVYFQTCPGVFSLTPSQILGSSSTTAWPQSLTAADLNGDGLIDLASASRDNNTLTVFYQTSPGQFPTSLSLGGTTFMNFPWSIASADLNGDGLLDLASANRASSNLTVFLQTAPGQFPSVPSLTLSDPSMFSNPSSLTAADLNGDGLIDLAAASSIDDGVALFLQTSPGRFALSPSIILQDPANGGPSFVEAADLNSDGQIDIVSVGPYHLGVYFAR